MSSIVAFPGGMQGISIDIAAVEPVPAALKGQGKEFVRRQCSVSQCSCGEKSKTIDKTQNSTE